MAVTLKKTDTRGGRKKAKKLSSQGALLQAIWEKFGGIVSCSKFLNVHPQVLVNWKLRKVPLEMVGPISKKLNVPKAALNFIDVSAYENKEYDWVKLVYDCGLPPATTLALVGMSPPDKK